jgi:hypothetical protein
MQGQQNIKIHKTVILVFRPSNISVSFLPHNWQKRLAVTVSSSFYLHKTLLHSAGA